MMPAAIASPNPGPPPLKLVRPEEMEVPLQDAGLTVIDRTGVFYNVLADRWDLSRDMDVNYMFVTRREHMS